MREGLKPEAQDEIAFDMAVIERLGPHALAHQKLEVIEIFRLGWESGLARQQEKHEVLQGIRDAAQNLIKVKGRHHSEQAYQRLVAAVDAATEVKG